MVTPQPLGPVAVRTGPLGTTSPDVVGGIAPSGEWSLPPSADDAVARVAWSRARAPDGTRRVELVVSGELDLATSPHLSVAAALLCRSLDRPPDAVPFLLDMEGVTYLDTSGLDALNDIHALVAGHGWTLRLIPPAATVPRRVLLIAAREGWLPPSGAPRDDDPRDATLAGAGAPRPSRTPHETR